MGGVKAPSCLFLIAVFVMGCTTTTNPAALLRGRSAAQSDMISTSSLEPPARSNDCYLDMVLDRNPVRPYVVIGRASSSWTGVDGQGLDGTDSSVLLPLRAEACRAGGHVLFQYNARFDDHWIPRSGANSSTPAGSFVRRIRSTALVAVYVSREGEVMQPPTGARRVIRVPASLPEERAGEGDVGMHPAWEQGITDPWAVPAP